MKNDEQIFFKIENYLDGKLSQTEASAFEQEIADDRELAETVEMHRFERESLEYMVGQGLRKKIKDWEQNPPDTAALHPKPAATRRQWWPLALGGLAVLLLIVFAINSGHDKEQTTPKAPVNPTESPTKSETPQQQVPIATDTPEKPPTSLPTAPPTQKSYDEKMLALAESNFGVPNVISDDDLKGVVQANEDPLKSWKEQLRQPKPDCKTIIAALSKIKGDEEADALLAYAYFKDKQFGKSAAIYQRLANSTKLTPAQKDEAEWHLLMSLLPDNSNHKKVDSLISKMTNPDNYHEYLRVANELKAKLPQ